MKTAATLTNGSWRGTESSSLSQPQLTQRLYQLSLMLISHHWPLPVYQQMLTLALFLMNLLQLTVPVQYMLHYVHCAFFLYVAIRSVARPAPKRHTTRKKQIHNTTVEPPAAQSGKTEKASATGGADVKKTRGGKGGGRRHRTSSSGSISEDDVFVITEVCENDDLFFIVYFLPLAQPCWNGDGSQRHPSSQSEDFSPGSPDKSSKKSKNKKKKKRKDSDGDKGGENSSDSSPPVSRGKKGRGRRSRTDSLTQSSDDDNGRYDL